MEKMRTRNLYFTLLEILIVIFIVSIASVGIALQIGKAVSEEHFNQSAKELKERLQLAHDLMMYNDIDSKLTITPAKDGSLLIAEVKGTYYKKDEIEASNKKMLAKTLQAASKKLKLKNLYISLETASDKTIQDSIHLDFKASGETMPQGTLFIYNNPERNREKGFLLIQLKDYPRQLYKLSSEHELESSTEGNNEKYDILYPTLPKKK
jgi:type II secretory pathway pseudopilin PulG